MPCPCILQYSHLRAGKSFRLACSPNYSLEIRKQKLLAILISFLRLTYSVIVNVSITEPLLDTAVPVRVFPAIAIFTHSRVFTV
jgi:hypothetical protein